MHVCALPKFGLRFQPCIRNEWIHTDQTAATCRWSRIRKLMRDDARFYLYMHMLRYMHKPPKQMLKTWRNTCTTLVFPQCLGFKVTHHRDNQKAKCKQEGLTQCFNVLWKPCCTVKTSHTAYCIGWIHRQIDGRSFIHHEYVIKCVQRTWWNQNIANLRAWNLQNIAP